MHRTKIETGDRPTSYPPDAPIGRAGFTRVVERLIDIPIMLMVLLLGIPLLAYCILTSP